MVKKRKYPQVVNSLKQSISAMSITKYILDLKVNLTIGELLAAVLAIEKQLTKAITENKVVQF